MRRPMRTLCLMLVSWLLGIGLSVAAPRVTPGELQPSPPPPTSTPSETPDTDSVPNFYQPFLSGQRQLGFNPDQHLFDRVRHSVEEEYVDASTDDQLWRGAADEVRKLIEQAGQNPAWVDGIAINEHLPQAVVEQYGAHIDRNLLWYALIRGELGSLKDPYTVLMIPDDYRHMMDSMRERAFGGIGIYIELDKANGNKLTITEPIEGTPAVKAGLEAGDVIVDIDGKPTDGMQIDAAAAMLRGNVGSNVVLTISRTDTPAPLQITVTRDQIHPPSVTSKMLDGKIGYIRLRIFAGPTGDELSEALQHLRADGMRGLILDLRNNGGGYINSAVAVCSNFIPAGSLIVSVESRVGQAEEHRASPTEGSGRSLPMVLLVNNYSASASEITAGCLKDLGVATLVGVKTFGKGSVQSVKELPQEAALKLTIAHFFSPKHNIIHHVGIQPDIEVPMEARLVGHPGDTQMAKAIDVLNRKVGSTSSL